MALAADKFEVQHRLASEELLHAVVTGNAEPLQSARRAGERAHELAESEAQRVLSRGLLRSVDQVANALRGKNC